MADYQLRPFAFADVPAITALYRHYVDTSTVTFETEPPSEAAMADKFGQLLALGHPLLVAEAAGELLGYAYASTYRPRPGYRFTCEDSIYLRPDATGRGLGSALLAELIAGARRFGFRQMLAVITAGTENSLRLHTKLGFRPVGHLTAVGFKFDRWLDIEHLQLAL